MTLIDKATCPLPEMVRALTTDESTRRFLERLSQAYFEPRYAETRLATDMGLIVPTVYDADSYTLAALAKQVNAIAQRARANKLTVQDMQNSTFVVNNPGTFGTIISVPIINQPNAAILSMDAVVKRPVVIEDDAIAVRYMMYLSLSFDHRILDGAGANGFLQAVRLKLQSYGTDIDVY